MINMGDLAHGNQKKGPGGHQHNHTSSTKQPWWKALRRASNESQNQNKKELRRSVPITEIRIPTCCLLDVTESPQDYLDRILQQRGYSTQRTAVDACFRDSTTGGRNEAHHAVRANQWKSVHAVLAQQGRQLFLQTDHTGCTPLMLIESDADWGVWLQFLEASIIDKYWPDPNAPPADDEDESEYSDVGSVGSAPLVSNGEDDDDDDDPVEESSSAAEEQERLVDQLAATTLQEKEDAAALAQEYFQAALEARG